MRQSARTTAALKNFRATLDTRTRSLPSEPKGDLVARGSGGIRETAPDIREMIDRALAERRKA